VLRRETSLDIGAPMISFGPPRGERTPTLRQREADPDPAEGLGGLWNEEEFTSGHQGEPFPGVSITSAGESCVRVPLAPSRPDAVADGHRGGERPSNDDPGERVARVAARNRIGSDLDRKSPAVRARRLKVGDTKDRIRGVSLKHQRVARRWAHGDRYSEFPGTGERPRHTIFSRWRRTARGRGEEQDYGEVSGPHGGKVRLAGYDGIEESRHSFREYIEDQLLSICGK
jgi:hypothetical protein